MATISPFRRPTPRNGRQSALGAIDWRSLLHLILRLAGFLSTTILLSWGVFVLAMLAIGGFSVDGLMHHLANLSTRYVAADSARVDQFKMLLLTANAVIAAVVLVVRRHAILSLVRVRREASHG